MREKVLVLDFGSQYTQLIARRIRELGVYSEIKPYNTTADEIRKDPPGAIILSGGPSSVWEDSSPRVDGDIFSLEIPLLGICYGLQVLVFQLGGEVERSLKREYGPAVLTLVGEDPLFSGVKKISGVWMSHGDRVLSLPEGFTAVAGTENTECAAVRNMGGEIYGVQFHPEVAHTEFGARILSNFLFHVAGLEGNWTAGSFIEHSIHDIRERVGDGKIICGLSGGVDSSVAAALINEAVGRRLHCIFVDTGCMRLDEADEVRDAFSGFDMNFIQVDASQRFLSCLEGVKDPETKRKIIGEQFVRVFEEEAEKISDVRFLAQGTLYPDVIESVSVKGPSAVIKSHHNVGGLPEKMNLEIVEPLRELFKDEVRDVGEALGLPSSLTGRHPFPGPGLAIRIMGEVTHERLSILRHADSIFIEELKKSGAYDEIWQAFCVFIPVKTVGVMGDERTYENVCALRAVNSTDGMTADWSKISYDLLGKISVRIINEVKGINRVVYDISTKPPGTIEWQ
ncbi:MAG: glutamine-hydrolyzing GMP synthase [Candidatus Dadabacteria bacterium]|nr:glutamine-hydrolyzing GMP synthase [Candidatus Dadabacteria bacterium]MCY4261936.1 glutamine-hydrolyzing GMP synthase [Candidatus Dadabacteria bacterium]